MWKRILILLQPACCSNVLSQVLIFLAVDMTSAPGEPLEVTLYHYPLTRSTRVLWLLNELGDKVKFTCKRLELMKGEAHSSEFLRLNPNHALPVLIYKDESGEERALFESCAIVEFLTDALAVGELAPPSGISHSRAEYKTHVWNSKLLPFVLFGCCVLLYSWRKLCHPCLSEEVALVRRKLDGPTAVATPPAWRLRNLACWPEGSSSRRPHEGQMDQGPRCYRR